jgi:D-sedoheptulose 7-phosphate isomerase
VERRVDQWLAEATAALTGIDISSIVRAVTALAKVTAQQGTIYTAGNGGSAGTASHLALDLQKAARAPGGRGTRAVCLSDNVGLLTAWGNDTSFERIFVEQLDVLGRPEDGVVVISVSGSSPNLIALLQAARSKGMTSIGLLGRDGGRAAAMVDAPVIVRSDDYGWVESAHVVLHHVLTYALRDAASSFRAPLKKVAAT